MAITETVSEVRVLKRRIIERPRLFALLDDSKARVRTLIAPAGYGKSTLAEQWVHRSGRRGAWFTARSSSTDVAALALGLARSAATIVPGCDARLREYLRAVPAPADNVGVLAEILGEDLASWPTDAWLVIDDYHEVAQEPKSEEFVDTLIDAAPIQFLIASRQRPSWVSTKRILYGGLLELSKTALAMDNHEAAEVLLARTEASASGLVALANGWPAVIGLASVSSAEIESDVEQLPESLYRFFAEEVFSALGDEVQQGLTTLSVAPVLDRDLVHELLGADSADRISAAALDVGILVERGAQLELHPLARAFLADRSHQFAIRPTAGAHSACLAHYRTNGEWDAAFEITVRDGEPEEFASLMHDALDELLEAGRLSTLQSWTETAAQLRYAAPIVSVARGEVMLRTGRHLEAIAHGQAAASQDPALAYRGLSVAGRAAHLASREEEALELYQRAHDAALSDSDRRDALWGELRSLIDLEDPTAERTLEQLSAGVSLGQPRDFVRTAAHRLFLGIRLGSLDLEQADLANDVLPALDDPLVESSFLSGYASALALSARYQDAQDVSTRLSDVAQRYRLQFAMPYALCGSAMAHSGLRQWSKAEARAREALDLARHSRDSHVEQLSNAILLRTLAQQGRLGAALDLGVSEPRGAIKASRSELLCSQALVFACAGRLSEALELAGRGRSLTKALESVVLAKAVEAICSLKSGAPEAMETVADLANCAFGTGALDPLVVSYRACPELLVVLVRAGETDRVASLLRSVGDADLAAAAGRPIDGGQLLTPREREVYELVCGGLTNREIARLLYIEESTVKVHVHHIYDKLGVRSRMALTVQAMLQRSDQATSATGSADTEERSP